MCNFDPYRGFIRNRFLGQIVSVLLSIGKWEVGLQLKGILVNCMQTCQHFSDSIVSFILNSDHPLRNVNQLALIMRLHFNLLSSLCA